MKIKKILSWVFKGDNSKDFKFFKREVALAESSADKPAGAAHFMMILKDLPFFAFRIRKYVLNRFEEYKKNFP